MRDYSNYKLKTVLVEMKTLMLMEVPDHNDEDRINFWLNESSHCAANEFESLYEATKDNNYCGCFCTEFKYLREADEEDKEANTGIFIKWNA